MSHTAGPWVARQNGKYTTENPWSVDHEDGHDNTCAPVGGPDGQVVALVLMDDEHRTDRWDDGELDANADLIAAAPEMLAGLRAAAAQFRLYEQYHRAKETPESDEKAVVNGKLAHALELTIAKATGEGPCPKNGETYHRWADGYCHKCGAKRNG